RHHLALHAGTDGILRRHVLPGVRLQLFQSQADPLALPIDVEDLHLDFLADVDHFGGVRDSPVTHVGDVEQSVHAPEVDERAEVGDVLDDPFPDLPTCSSFIKTSRLVLRSASSRTRRLTTMLRRRLFSLMILNSKLWPSSS